MPNYRYFCEACGAEQEMRHSMKADITMVCECGKDMERECSGGTGFIFQDSMTTQESSKPESYWNNAEMNRQKAVERKRREAREKVQYRDPETIQKLENKARNMKNQGKTEEAEQIERAIE